MKVEREGLGYRAAIVGEGIDLFVDRLTETRGETYGELRVARAPEGELMRTRLSISSSPSRYGASKYLTRRDRQVDWLKLLEEFCAAVLTQEREGNPVKRVGKLPPRPQVEFLVEPLMPVGKPMILFGEEGTGKSTLAAAIAVMVATGISTFGRWTVRQPRNVLILDWEADEDDWNDLIAAVSAGIGIDPPEVLYRACAAPLSHDLHEIARIVTEDDVGLAIVDSVGLASPSSREGSDANDGAMRLFGALRHLPTTKLLLDHVTKAGGSGDAPSRPYGSVYKPALARATYELRAAEEADPDGSRHLALFHRKHNQTAKQGPQGIKALRTDTEILLTPEPPLMSDSRIAKGATLVERIRDALKPGPMTVEDVSAAVESSVEIVRATLNRGRKQGMFVSVQKAGEKANLWANGASETAFRNTFRTGRETGGAPLGGDTPRVPQTSRPTEQQGAFDSLSKANQDRVS